MSDANDLTGYQGGDDASGKGGRARLKTVDSIVNQGQGPSDNSPPSAPRKAHPAAYKPSAQENKSKQYGSPINAPILGSGS